MKRYISKNMFVIVFSLLTLGAASTVSAQQVQQMTEQQWDNLLVNLFEKNRLCPDGFDQSGQYPKTAWCASRRDVKNCSTVAEGCRVRVMPVELKPNGKLEVCVCPAAISNWQ